MKRILFYHILVLLSIGKDDTVDLNICSITCYSRNDLLKIKRSNGGVRHHKNLLPMNMPALKFQIFREKLANKKLNSRNEDVYTSGVNLARRESQIQCK